MDRRVSDRIAEMQKINPQTVESKMDATTVAANYHKIVAEERRKMRTPGRATYGRKGRHIVKQVERRLRASAPFGRRRFPRGFGSFGSSEP